MRVIRTKQDGAEAEAEGTNGVRDTRVSEGAVPMIQWRRRGLDALLQERGEVAVEVGGGGIFAVKLSGKVGHAGSVNRCDFVRVCGRCSEEFVGNATELCLLTLILCAHRAFVVRRFLKVLWYVCFG